LKPNTTFTPRESAPWTLSAPGVVLALLGQRDVEDHRPRALSRQLVQEGGEARAARRIEAKILSLRVGARPRGRLQAERDDPELIAERDVEEPVAHPRDAVLEPDVDRVEEVRPGERENDQGNGGNHEERPLHEPDEARRIGRGALALERARQALDVAVERSPADLAVLEACEHPERRR